MKKFIKIFFIVLIILFALMIILPFAFKGKIKGMALNEANKSLNAKLELGGISLTMLKNFPNVYVGLNDIIITGKGNFEGDTLLVLKKLGLSVSLSDLIGGSPYEIKEIMIGSADVRLKVLEDGMANWDIVKASESAEEEAAAEGEDNFRLLLTSLVIDDSRLVYDDRSLPAFIRMEGFNHSLSGDLGADFTSLSTQTDIAQFFLDYDGMVYFRDAKIDWKAGLDADLVKSVYTFKENELKINALPVVFNGSVGLPESGYDLDLTLGIPGSSFKALLSLVPAVYARDFESIQTDGLFSFEGYVKGKYLDEVYPAFLFDLKVENAWFRYPDLPSAVNDINITARIENPGGDLDNTIIDVGRLDLDMAGNPVRVKLFLKNPMSDPYLDTRITANIDLAEIQKIYPLEEGEAMNGNIDADITLKGKLSDIENERYDAFEASGNFSTSGISYETPYFARKLQIEKAALSITPAYLDLPELKVKAGNSDFSLKGKIDNYLAYYLKGETLTGRFNLVSQRIDVNELLTFPETGEDAETDDTAAMSAFEVPAGVDFILDVAVGAIDYMDYDLRDLKGKVRIKDQTLYLDGISVNGLGGKLEMAGMYKTTDPENPEMDFDLGLKDISIKETFRQFSIVEKYAPIAEKVIGDFSGKVKLSGLLDGQMMPRLESLSGLGNLQTSELQISNVNTLNQLSNSLKMDQLQELKVAGTKLIVEFLGGSMEVKPFDFKALGIDMNLGGKTSLDQAIVYDLKMKIPRNMMGGAANGVLNDMVNKANQSGAGFTLGDYVNVDALIDGTISDPKVRLNLAGTGKGLAETVKEEIKEQVEQKVEEVKGMAKEEADKILQEADRQAQAILDQAKKQSDEVMKQAQALADETKKQANANADKLVNEAKGKGMVAELAAKKSAEEVRKQGDKQAQNILDEARKNSDAILNKASQEAGKIKSDAQKKIDQ
jgi:cell division septum initiation protein DivIVA